MLLVVHPHLHRRHTGVSTHAFSMVRALQGHADARAHGTLLEDGLPTISVEEVLDRARAEPVVWHAHRNNELLLGLWLRARRPRLRVVFTRHGDRPPGAFTRLLLRRADAVVALNPFQARDLGVPCTIVPHGVDLARCRPAAAGEPDAWAALGLPGRHGIGVVGRLRPEKGQEDFVRAWAPLAAAHPDWHAALVGAARPRHAAWAQGLADLAKGSLSLVGEQRDIARWYRGFTVLVNPSHSESFGLTVLEGMACGACVVASALPHLSAFVEHGRTGFLYPPGDVAALRDVLEGLLKDPARAKEIGARAARAAKERFGAELEAASLLLLYQRVVAGR